MASLAIYAKKPLDLKLRSIRLLEIVKHKQNTSISCHLHVVQFPSSLPYVALSYCWGFMKSEQIIIDGAELPIGDNLWRFISNLQPQNSPAFFWIDAICIDQGNKSEISHQVPMMREIYSLASTVFVWLGQADKESDAAMGFMMSIATGSSDPWSTDHANDMFAFATRAYWTRMWILQEFMLAYEPTLLCGTKTLDWNGLKRVLKYLKEEEVKGNDEGWARDILDRNMFRIIVDKIAFDSLPAEKRGMPLNQLVAESYDAECSIMHDKVYSLLGLVLPEELSTRPKVDINYDSSLSDLCDQTLRHIFPKDDPATLQERLASLIRLRYSLRLQGQSLTHSAASVLAAGQNIDEALLSSHLKKQELKFDTVMKDRKMKMARIFWKRMQKKASVKNNTG